MLRNKVTFDILWGTDASINKGYGIDAFPQVVLLDAAGVVSYSGPLDVQRIMAIINKGEVDAGLRALLSVANKNDVKFIHHCLTKETPRVSIP